MQFTFPEVERSAASGQSGPDGRSCLSFCPFSGLPLSGPGDENRLPPEVQGQPVPLFQIIQPGFLEILNLIDHLVEAPGDVQHGIDQQGLQGEVL